MEKSDHQAMPTYLYHGSRYDNKGKPLINSFSITGIEVLWDGKLESNRYLYAADSVEEAILLGIGSLAEKELGTTGFSYEAGGNEAIFHFPSEELLTEKELQRRLKDKVVYLYTIKVRPEHEWVENFNSINKMIGEYKTLGSVPAKDYVKTQIKVMPWLIKNNWEIVTRTRDI